MILVLFKEFQIFWESHHQIAFCCKKFTADDGLRWSHTECSCENITWWLQHCSKIKESYNCFLILKHAEKIKRLSYKITDHI